MRNIIRDIIGIIWILIGVIGLIKPVFIRNFLNKKTRMRKFKFFILFAFILISFFLELFFRFDQLIIRIVIAVGFIFILKLILMLNKKVSEKIAEYLLKVPCIYLRLIALIFLVMGIVFFKIL
jgi:uncharacterized protein YjeT (DUF2065 family)